jgi:DNA replication and repair protein RecF
MAVKRLYLENFRIHKSFLFEGDYDFVFIEGQNGTGKTSILEAISFFAPGKGLRNVKFNDAIKLSENAWTAFISIENNEDTTDIGMSCGLSSRRIIKVNDKLVRSSSALLEKLRVIWLTPSQDGLLAESKSLRRKFLDRLVYNFDISHAETMAKYEHALKSRLKLLKAGDPDEIWLTQLERALAEASIKIAASRLNTIARLNREVKDNRTEFFPPNISLLCEIAESLNSSSYEQILESFRRFRAVDAKVGRSLYGVHRADFIINNPIKHISAHKSSTGELKIMLISLILAQIKSLNEIDGIKPILLMDDIFSHLDQNKILSLIQELILIDAQIWITGTNFSNLSNIKICKKYVKVSL